MRRPLGCEAAAIVKPCRSRLLELKGTQLSCVVVSQVDPAAFIDALREDPARMAFFRENSELESLIFSDDHVGLQTVRSPPPKHDTSSLLVCRASLALHQRTPPRVCMGVPPRPMDP
jgi:hypothetical protein